MKVDSRSEKWLGKKSFLSWSIPKQRRTPGKLWSGVPHGGRKFELP